jgi:DNA polymerase III subunit gamma/tau
MNWKSFQKKKKSDQLRVTKQEDDLSLPSRSEIIRNEVQPVEKKVNSYEAPSGKHDPVIEKPSKTFSIKELINEDIKPDEKTIERSVLNDPEVHFNPRNEFTPEAFNVAWHDFTDQLKGEGTRIISMFKSIRPEVENDQTIKIHLNNATQKDTFILNYRQRLINFLESKFILSDIDIETIVDLTETSEILYSDEQKFNYLINKYPILKEMKKTFNLDIT